MPSGHGYNINQILRDTVADHGSWYDHDLFNILRGHTALQLTTATTPKLVLSSDYTYVQWDAASTATAYAKLRLPRSAAFRSSIKAATRAIPFLRFRLNLGLRMAGATDTPVVTVTAKLRAMNGAIKATFTPTSIAADGSVLTDGTCKALANDTNPTLRTWDFNETYGTGPVYAAPGDSLDIKIVPGAHGTDAIELHQAYLELAENAAYTDDRQRQI